MPHRTTSVTRGVYRLPWRGRKGEAFVVAVNSLGQRVLEATVLCQDDCESAIDYLWDLLDEVDPSGDGDEAPVTTVPFWLSARPFQWGGQIQ